MSEYIERLYCSYAYGSDHEPSVNPYDELLTSDFTKEDERKEYAKNHLKNVLYWLYKSETFDAISFERELEEACAYLDLSLPDSPMKRNVS